MTLNQIVEKYLSSNGIEKKFFANYIGCGLSKCSLWFKGEQVLDQKQLQKTHDFLLGKHIKTVDEIVKGE